MVLAAWRRCRGLGFEDDSGSLRRVWQTGQGLGFEDGFGSLERVWGLMIVLAAWGGCRGVL